MCEGDLKVVMLLDPELLPASFVFFCTPPPPPAAASLPLPPELIRRGLYKPAAMAAVLVKLALLCSKVGSAFSPVDIESVVGLLGATAKTQWW